MQIFMTETDGSVFAVEVKSITIHKNAEVWIILENGNVLKLHKDDICEKKYLFRTKSSDEPYVDYGYDMVAKYYDEFESRVSGQLD